MLIFGLAVHWEKQKKQLGTKKKFVEKIGHDLIFLTRWAQTNHTLVLKCNASRVKAWTELLNHVFSDVVIGWWCWTRWVGEWTSQQSKLVHNLSRLVRSTVLFWILKSVLNVHLHKVSHHQTQTCFGSTVQKWCAKDTNFNLTFLCQILSKSQSVGHFRNPQDAHNTLNAKFATPHEMWKMRNPSQDFFFWLDVFEKRWKKRQFFERGKPRDSCCPDLHESGDPQCCALWARFGVYFCCQSGSPPRTDFKSPPPHWLSPFSSLWHKQKISELWFPWSAGVAGANKLKKNQNVHDGQKKWNPNISPWSCLQDKWVQHSVDTVYDWFYWDWARCDIGWKWKKRKSANKLFQRITWRTITWTKNNNNNNKKKERCWLCSWIIALAFITIVSRLTGICAEERWLQVVCSLMVIVVEWFKLCDCTSIQFKCNCIEQALPQLTPINLLCTMRQQFVNNVIKSVFVVVEELQSGCNKLLMIGV